MSTCNRFGAKFRPPRVGHDSHSERIPKGRTLVIGVKARIRLRHRGRRYQRLELGSRDAERRPDRRSGRVWVANLRELRPVGDHRLGELLLLGRKCCRCPENHEVLNLCSVVGAQRKADRWEPKGRGAFSSLNSYANVATYRDRDRSALRVGQAQQMSVVRALSAKGALWKPGGCGG
jgi:hypothetical protein